MLAWLFQWLVNSLFNTLLMTWIRSRETAETRRLRALRSLRWGWWPLLALGAIPYAVDVAGIDVPWNIKLVGWTLLVCGCVLAGSAFGVLSRDGTPQERRMGLVGNAMSWLAFFAVLLMPKV